MKKIKRSNKKTEEKWKVLAKKHGFKSSKEMFVTLFLKYNQNSQKIAKKLNVTVTTVYDQYKKFGIKITKKRKYSKKFNWEIIAKKHGFKKVKKLFKNFKGEYTVYQLASKFNCSSSTLYREVRKYGFLSDENDNYFLKGKKKINAKSKDEKNKICSYCGKRFIHRGFKYLCYTCWKEEGE